MKTLLLLMSFVVAMASSITFAATVAVDVVEDAPAPPGSALMIMQLPPMTVPPYAQSDPLLRQAFLTNDYVCRNMIAIQMNRPGGFRDPQFRLALTQRLADIRVADRATEATVREVRKEEEPKHKKKHREDGGNNIMKEMAMVAIMAKFMSMMTHQNTQPGWMQPGRPWPMLGGYYGGGAGIPNLAAPRAAPMALPMPGVGGGGFSTATGPSTLAYP